MDENPNCVLSCEFRAVVRWPPYWSTGRLADNQKMRNLTDNLSKMSNKTFRSCDWPI